MRDLYKKLNISQSATRPQIEEAIKKINNQKLKGDASYVLLDKNRKRVFDRCNISLKRIGKLRSELGLSHSPNWLANSFSEYDRENNGRSAKTKGEQTDKHTNQNKDKSDISDNRRSGVEKKDHKWTFIAIVVVLLMIAITNIPDNNNSDTLSDSINNRSAAPTANESSNINQGETENELLDYEDIFGERSISNNDNSISQEPAFDKEPSPLPINGYTYNYTSKPELAPLEIITPIFSDHYFVVLEDYYSGERAFILFIRAGQDVDVTVPLGTYRMKYATGEDWYGVQDLFGPGDMTTRFKTNDRFEFKEERYQYTGYTVELIKQAGGNMYTREVSASEW